MLVVVWEVVLVWKEISSLGVAAICWAIWKCRNKAVFEGKVIKNPLKIICHACVLMIYWTGLYAELDRDQLVESANTMLRVAKEILAAQTTRQVNQLLLEDGEPWRLCLSFICFEMTSTGGDNSGNENWMVIGCCWPFFAHRWPSVVAFCRLWSSFFWERPCWLSSVC